MLTLLLQFILNHRKLALVGLLVLVSAGILTYSRFTASPKTSPQIVEPKKAYLDLVPNRSTHQDIIDQLGEPQSVYEQDGMTIYMYPSTTSYYAPDQLYVKNDILQLKELYYTPEQFSYTLQRLTDQYGNPEKVLYLPYNPYTANYVYAYPTQGVAAYITKEDKVFKVQHFAPSDLSTYQQRWGKGLSDRKPTEPSEVDPHTHQ